MTASSTNGKRHTAIAAAVPLRAVSCFAMLDAFDPSNWAVLEAVHDYRIYGDDREAVWVRVDAVDYHWAIQWRWNVLIRRNKRYLRRAVPVYDDTGKRWHQHRLTNATQLLHVAIMQRTEKPQPSPRHVLVDHRDGDHFNCTRPNLRWVTPRMNVLNRYGSHAHVEEELV